MVIYLRIMYYCLERLTSKVVTDNIRRVGIYNLERADNMDNRQKYAMLKTLREEEPLVWCVVRGAKTIPQMAKTLLWLPKDVQAGLDEEDDLSQDGSRWEINLDSHRMSQLIELQEFARALFVKVAAWERAQRGPRALTDKQAQFLQQLSELPQPFTTSQAAKAQGLSKPGFTQNQLMALVKKNLLVEIGGRPRKWQLSDSPVIE